MNISNMNISNNNISNMNISNNNISNNNISNNNISNNNISNNIKIIKNVINIKKFKNINDDIILKTIVKNYSWEDLKFLSSI